MSTLPADAARPSGWGFWLRPDVLVAVGAIVVLLPASIAALVQMVGSDKAPTTALLVALFTLQLAAPIISARHPLAGFGVATAAMAALALLPPAVEVSAALYPSGVGYLLCLSQVASREPCRWTLVAWGSGIFGAALIALTTLEFVAGERTDTGLRLGSFAGLAAAVTAAAAVGLLLRARRLQAEERTRTQVRQAIDDERMRISRDLHDVVAHAMTVMIAQTDVARALLHDDPDRADRALATAGDTGREALRGMRSAVRAEPDAAREPAPTLDDLPALVASVRSPVCETTLAESGDRMPLAAPVALALHRAVREGLTNAVRHTQHPVRIAVRLEWEGDAVIARIEDDGGAGAATAGLGSGTGLVGLTERVESVGGKLTAGPRDPRGWALIARLPARSNPLPTHEATEER